MPTQNIVNHKEWIGLSDSYNSNGHTIIFQVKSNYVSLLAHDVLDVTELIGLLFVYSLKLFISNGMIQYFSMFELPLLALLVGPAERWNLAYVIYIQTW